MSPEQAQGQRDQLDTRSDIYSLGATLCELATLQPVFDGTNRYQLIEQVVAGQRVAPHQLDPAIPEPLRWIINQAMARRPADRYQSAQELADDPQRFLTNEEILAIGPSDARHTARRLVRRRPAIWSGAALLLILAVVRSLMLTQQWPFLAARRDAPAWNHHGVELASLGDLQQAAEHFHRAIRLGPPRAEYYSNRGVMYASRGELARAAADCDEALRLDPEFAVAIANRAITRAWPLRCVGSRRRSDATAQATGPHISTDRHEGF